VITALTKKMMKYNLMKQPRQL